MAKSEPLKFNAAPGVAAATEAEPAAPASPPPVQAPALGTACTVRVAAGIDLINNDTGTLFVPEQDTPVTCTVTLLRRLRDGDLTLVA